MLEKLGNNNNSRTEHCSLIRQEYCTLYW